MERSEGRVGPGPLSKSIQWLERLLAASELEFGWGYGLEERRKMRGWKIL